MVLACIAVLGVITPAFAHRLTISRSDDDRKSSNWIALSRATHRRRRGCEKGASRDRYRWRWRDLQRRANAYAARVRGDLSLAIDGRDVSLNLTSVSFPTEDEIRQGLGDIIITFEANIPSGSAERHQITFENHHQRSIAAYLVNALVPDDPRIRVLGQDRTRDQSSYRLDFAIGESAMAMSQPSIVVIRRGVADARRQSRADQNIFLARRPSYPDWVRSSPVSGRARPRRHDALGTRQGRHRVHDGAFHHADTRGIGVGTSAERSRRTADRREHRFCRRAECVLARPIAMAAARLLVAFSFGLFHGLGFAGGLLKIMHQMPTTMILLAIFGFSVGVEAGNQIVLLPLFAFLRLLAIYAREASRDRPRFRRCSA